MAFESNWQKRQTWGAGVTAPILDVQFMEHDESEPRNITGFGAGVNFWYHDQTGYHLEGQGYISDPNNGVATYSPVGTEAPTVGDLIYQFEIMNPGSSDASVEEWATLSSPVFKVRVRESQP